MTTLFFSSPLSSSFTALIFTARKINKKNKLDNVETSDNTPINVSPIAAIDVKRILLYGVEYFECTLVSLYGPIPSREIAYNTLEAPYRLAFNALAVAKTPPKPKRISPKVPKNCFAAIIRGPSLFDMVLGSATATDIIPVKK